MSYDIIFLYFGNVNGRGFRYTATQCPFPNSIFYIWIKMLRCNAMSVSWLHFFYHSHDSYVSHLTRLPYIWIQTMQSSVRFLVLLFILGFGRCVAVFVILLYIYFFSSFTRLLHLVQILILTFEFRHYKFFCFFSIYSSNFFEVGEGKMVEETILNYV